MIDFINYWEAVFLAFDKTIKIAVVSVFKVSMGC